MSLERLHSKAWIEAGRMHVLGFAETPLGLLPFSVSRKVQGGLEDGPVTFGADAHPAAVAASKKLVGQASHQVESGQMKAAAKQLVDRARLGDQNAVAMIIRVRENAKKGSGKAKTALGLMLAYAKGGTKSASQFGSFFSSALASLRDTIVRVKSPAQYAAQVAVHVPEIGVSIADSANAAQALSKGPPITADLLTTMQVGLATDQAKAAFQYGVKACGNPKALVAASKTADADTKKALQLGFVAGLGKKFQDIRKPNASIASFSQAAAWELGEI